MKGRKSRATGGVNSAAEDMNTKPMSYTGTNKVTGEAMERKRGGKAMGKVHGAADSPHAGRKARKSGGRASSDANPFTSAAKGTPPKGHKVQTDWN